MAIGVVLCHTNRLDCGFLSDVQWSLEGIAAAPQHRKNLYVLQISPLYGVTHVG